MVQCISGPRPRRTGRLREWIGLLVRRAEPIAIVEQRFNFLPRSFRWRGNLQCIRQIARVWERTYTSQRAPRRYFEVICQDNSTRVLFQDLSVGTWYVSV